MHKLCLLDYNKVLSNQWVSGFADHVLISIVVVTWRSLIILNVVESPNQTCYVAETLRSREFLMVVCRSSRRRFLRPSTKFLRALRAILANKMADQNGSLDKLLANVLVDSDSHCECKFSMPPTGLANFHETSRVWARCHPFMSAYTASTVTNSLPAPSALSAGWNRTRVGTWCYCPAAILAAAKL